MAGTNGTDILVTVDDGASGWDIVGMQQDSNVEETTEYVDFSNKEQREMIGEPGRYSSTGTLDAVWMSSDTAYTTLETAMRTGVATKLQKTNNAVAFEEADVIITSLSRSEPDQGPVVASIGYQLSGGWTAVP